MLLVFTNFDTNTGQGMNWAIKPEEQTRLKRALDRLETVFELGHTLVLAEYPTYALEAGAFITNNLGPVYAFESFVGLHGFTENLSKARESAEGQPETVLVSCLSFYDNGWSDNESFFHYFSKWWNSHCSIFGMPRIPPHERGGDGSVLVIDYERHEISWINNVGKTVETVKTASAT